jgi:hypothetical protein
MVVGKARQKPRDRTRIKARLQSCRVLGLRPRTVPKRPYPQSRRTINKPPPMIDPLPIGVEDAVYNYGKPSMILPFEPRAGEALFTQLFEVPLSFFGFRDRRKDNRAFPLLAGGRFNAVGTRVSHFNDALRCRNQPDAKAHSECVVRGKEVPHSSYLQHPTPEKLVCQEFFTAASTSRKSTRMFRTLWPSSRGRFVYRLLGGSGASAFLQPGWVTWPFAPVAVAKHRQPRRLPFTHSRAEQDRTATS